MSQPAPRALHRICPSCDLEINDDRPDRTCPSCGSKLVEITGSNDDLIGTVIDERFEIRSLLGQGGMGSVYRAWQRSVGREVAIKLIDRAFARDAMAVRRFLREAKLASQLSQPNTVSVFDFGQASDGRLFIAMELIKGRTLHDVLVTDGTFSIARAVRVGVQICDALDAAHSINIMHRDMKLENLIVLDHPPGRDLVKVLDFGLAKTLGDDQSHGTKSGVVVGTPRYMAPEAAMSGIALPAGDLYALGVILAELTIGRALWTEVSLPALVAAKLDPSGVVAEIPIAIRDVIGRLLDPEPESRPTAAHTRELLTAIVETPSAPAMPPIKATPIATTLQLDPPVGSGHPANPANPASVLTRALPLDQVVAPRSPPLTPKPSANTALAYAATSASDSDVLAELRVSVATPAPLSTPRPAIAAPVVSALPTGTGVTLMPSTTSMITTARGRGTLVAGIAVAVAAMIAVTVVVATRGNSGPQPRAAVTPAANPAIAPVPAGSGSSATVDHASGSAADSGSAAAALGSAASGPMQVTLHVHSKPVGAMIVIDQKPIGVAPVDAVIRRGTGPVVITARLGGRSITQRVVPDQNREIDIVIPAAHGGTTSGGTTGTTHAGSGSDDQEPF